MRNRYPGKCSRCGRNVPAGAGTTQNVGGRWVVTHDECPEVTSGLGIGGAGSDDYSTRTESVLPATDYVPGSQPAGSQVCPAGTTYGSSSPGARCEICGAPADWNSGAGQHLCPNHWDEY